MKSFKSFFCLHVRKTNGFFFLCWFNSLAIIFKINKKMKSYKADISNSFAIFQQSMLLKQRIALARFTKKKNKFKIHQVIGICINIK